MKYLLVFSIATAVTLPVTAQTKSFPDTRQKISKNLLADREKKQLISLPVVYNNQSSPQQSMETYTLTNGDKVVVLPDYNTPSVVPDMKQFQVMPNAGKGVIVKRRFEKLNSPGQIPNKPYR